MDKKIISTFMFSEPHEQELLWLKFNVEDSFIHEWVIIEGAFSFQGKRKSKFLKKILEQPRFEKFRTKIHTIELESNYNFDYEPSFTEVLKRRVKRWLNRNRNKNYELVPYAEHASFHAEINQRGAGLSYLKSKYAPEDLIIVCDTDEIFDFGGFKGECLSQLIAKHPTPFYISREIFCYDFNNRTGRDRYSPVVKLKDLVSVQSFHHIRHPLRDRFIAKSDYTLAYEYTYCFSKEAILQKLSTFAHVTDLDQASVEFSLENNITLINPANLDTAYLKNKENFYELIKEEDLDAPKFLKDNFAHFRTNVVHLDYLESRKHHHIE